MTGIRGSDLKLTTDTRRGRLLTVKHNEPLIVQAVIVSRRFLVYFHDETLSSEKKCREDHGICYNIQVKCGILPLYLMPLHCKAVHMFGVAYQSFFMAKCHTAGDSNTDG